MRNNATDKLLRILLLGGLLARILLLKAALLGETTLPIVGQASILANARIFLLCFQKSVLHGLGSLRARCFLNLPKNFGALRSDLLTEG